MLREELSSNTDNEEGVISIEAEQAQGGRIYMVRDTYSNKRAPNNQSEPTTDFDVFCLDVKVSELSRVVNHHGFFCKKFGFF